MFDTLKAIGHYLDAVLDFFFLLFYYLFRSISYIVSFVESLFRRLVGIESMTINGSTIGGESSTDLVYGLIFNSQVQNLFWSILGFSIVLLVIFTIIALVKSEFSLDLKSSAKGPIIGRAFKAIINFFLVPIFTILAILGVNVLVRSINVLFNGDNNQGIVAKCFLVGAYGANRARLESDDSDEGSFYLYLKNGEFMREATADSQENPFADASNADELADLIDTYFTSTPTDMEINPIYSVDYRTFNDAGDYYEWEENSRNTSKYVPWQTLVGGSPGGGADMGTYPMYDGTAFKYYYNPREFDFILAIGSAVVIAWSLLTVCLALLKRAFELVILFVLSPAIISLAPLDEGKALTNWRGEVFKRMLAIVGPLFAYNIFFMMVGLLGNVEIFTVTGEGVLAFAGERLIEVFNIFFQLIVLIVALGLLKTASQMISSLLGMEDLISTGGQLSAKAMSTGTKAAMATVGAGAAVGGTIFKGTAAAAKGVKGSFTGFKERRALRNESQQQADYDAAKEDYKQYNNELTKMYISGDVDSDKYKDLYEKREAARSRMKIERRSIRLGNLSKKGSLDRINEIDKELANENLTSDERENLLAERDNLQKGNEELSKKYKSVQTTKSAFASGIKEEFGSDKSNSFIYNAGKKVQDKIKDSEFLKNHKGLGLIAEKGAGALNTASHVMGAGLRDNYNRMYDGILGLIGKDSGGGQAFSMFSSGDSRKALYQSEFEKKRADKAKNKKEEREKLEDEEEYRRELNRQERAEARKEQEAYDKARAEAEVKERERRELEEERVNMLNAAKIQVAQDENLDEPYKKLLKDRDAARRTGDENQIKVANAKIENFEAKNGLTDKAQEVVAKLGSDDATFERLQRIYATTLMEANQRAFTEAGVKLKEGTKIDTNIDFDKLSKTLKGTFEGLSKNISEMNTNFRDVASGMQSIKEFLEKAGNNGNNGTK